MNMTYTKDLSMMQILMISSLICKKLLRVDYEIKILGNTVWGSFKVN